MKGVAAMLARTTAVTAGLLSVAIALGAGSGLAATDSSCPSWNPPNAIELAGGSAQTGQLGKPFQASLQVKLTNTNGCALTTDLAGIYISFVAPTTGASGTFATNGSKRVLVGTDSQGVATAPAFTANDTEGDYLVTAESDYGTVEIYLVNTPDGLPAALAPTGPLDETATVTGRYAQPLQTRVTDANGNPVPGASVSFTVAASDTGAAASFLGGTSQASEQTDANGFATAPPLVAGKTAGTFTVTVSSGGAQPLDYTLTNVAGAPAAIAAGAASGQSAPVGSRYVVRLAVTVTDKQGNPVAGAPVVFTAPAHGPSGRFEKRAAAGTRVAHVETDRNGVAVAPPFVANRNPGGYAVTAATAHKRTAFALVNRPRR